jgi:CheY-like chemotaxis protein
MLGGRRMTSALKREVQEPLLLVVEDHQDGRDMLVEFFEHHGFRTSQAENGAEALDKITSERPAIVLLDLRMPHLTGIELLAHMRRGDRVVPPIVVYSGMDRRRVEEVHTDPNVKAVLMKPVPLPELLATIRRVLGVLAPPLRRKKS